MRQHVAFLHTSSVHIQTFDALLKAADRSVQVEHFVDEKPLADAQRVGAGDPGLVERVEAAMTNAASNGATIVVCTCSTIGGPAERTPTMNRFVAARIDRAMADRAVALGPKILIVAAFESTLVPTAELVRQSAYASRKTVEIEYLFVHEAWSHFQRGDRAAYQESIVSAIRAEPREADVIVLAQASMAPAAIAMSDSSAEVLASPMLGVRSILAHFENATNLT